MVAGGSSTMMRSQEQFGPDQHFNVVKYTNLRSESSMEQKMRLVISPMRQACTLYSETGGVIVEIPLLLSVAPRVMTRGPSMVVRMFGDGPYFRLKFATISERMSACETLKPFASIEESSVATNDSQIFGSQDLSLAQIPTFNASQKQHFLSMSQQPFYQSSPQFQQQSVQLTAPLSYSQPLMFHQSQPAYGIQQPPFVPPFQQQMEPSKKNPKPSIRRTVGSGVSKNSTPGKKVRFTRPTFSLPPFSQSSQQQQMSYSQAPQQSMYGNATIVGGGMTSSQSSFLNGNSQTSVDSGYGTTQQLVLSQSSQQKDTIQEEDLAETPPLSPMQFGEEIQKKLQTVDVGVQSERDEKAIQAAFDSIVDDPHKFRRVLDELKKCKSFMRIVNGARLALALKDGELPKEIPEKQALPAGSQLLSIFRELGVL